MQFRIIIFIFVYIFFFFFFLGGKNEDTQRLKDNQFSNN